MGIKIFGIGAVILVSALVIASPLFGILNEYIFILAIIGVALVVWQIAKWKAGASRPYDSGPTRYTYDTSDADRAYDAAVKQSEDDE